MPGERLISVDDFVALLTLSEECIEVCVPSLYFGEWEPKDLRFLSPDKLRENIHNHLRPLFTD